VTLKELITGGTGRTVILGAICYQIATKNMKDSRAARAIKPYYEKYREAVETETAVGVPDDVVFGPILYFQYLWACGALVKVDGSPEYEQAIGEYFDHPREQVRYWAEHVLEIEGRLVASCRQLAVS
jgi:hypothetical protein